MSKNDARKIASMLVEHDRQLEGLRAKQLPFSSVTLDDGTAQGVLDGAVAARDALEISEVHDASLVDLSDIADNSAVESTFLPERIAVIDGSADSAFDLGMAAAERVTRAQAAADQAASDALAAAQAGQLAFEAAAEATSKSTAAESAATEAMTKATQAAADVVEKANAAEQAAKEYAQARADAAQAEAIAEASGDASAKAEAAHAAAIAAAAEDAAIKAAQAEAAAKEVAFAAQIDADRAIIDAAKALADASAALSSADRAQATADGRNRVFAQALNPVASPAIPFVGGDLWYRTETVGGVERFAGVSMWNGTEWKPYQLVADSLLVPGSIGAVLIKNGEITGPKLAVDALNFKTATGMNLTAATLTGSTIRTAASGQRMEFNKFGIQGYNNLNQVVAELGISNDGIFKLNGTVGGVSLSGPYTAVAHQGHEFRITTGDTFGIRRYKSATDNTILNEFSVWGGMGWSLRSDGYMTFEQNFPPPGGEWGRGLNFAGPKRFEQYEKDARQADVQMSGYDNFLFTGTGRFQTYGQMIANGLTVFGTEGGGLSKMSDFYGPVRFNTQPTFPGDTDWVQLAHAGSSGSAQWRRIAGIIWFQFDITLAAALPAGQAINQLTNLPLAARPVGNTPISSQAHGSYDAQTYVEYSSGDCAVRNTDSVSRNRFKGAGQWPARGV